MSQLMHQQGGDEELRELGPYGYTERWRVNQVLLYYLDPVLDSLRDMNPEMVEGDLAPMRAFAGRRQGWFWYMGGAEGGALLYDADADLLFLVKGLVSTLDFLMASAQLIAPCELYATLLPWTDASGEACITYDGILLHEKVNPISPMRLRSGVEGRDAIGGRATAILTRPPITALTPEHARPECARLVENLQTVWQDATFELPTRCVPASQQSRRCLRPISPRLLHASRVRAELGRLALIEPSLLGSAAATPEEATRWWEAGEDELGLGNLGLG